MKAFESACEALKNGGVIIHATEAVFGLAGSMYDLGAFKKLSRLKNRPFTKKFIILVSDLNSASDLVDINVEAKAEIISSWPGPNTWILPATDATPRWLVDSSGLLAIRVTAHSQCREIINQVGPILSTSANRAGGVPPKSLEGARGIFKNEVDFYLDGLLGGLETVTAIKNGLTGQILRN